VRRPWPPTFDPQRLQYLHQLAICLAGEARRPAPERRDPWRTWPTIAAVGGALLVGAWLLRPTRPPAFWIASNRARDRRLQSMDDRFPSSDAREAAPVNPPGTLRQSYPSRPRSPPNRTLSQATAPALDAGNDEDASGDRAPEGDSGDHGVRWSDDLTDDESGDIPPPPRSAW
jgi:hypothetical protein